MKKFLIYDNECPLCQWYSKKFVQLGILGEKERMSFSSAHYEGIFQKIDQQRATQEIPLYIPEANLVLYGTDSIVYLLNLKVPGIKRLYNTPPIKWLSKHLYNFVSFNRRIIATPSCNSEACLAEPPVNKIHRSLYITLAHLIAFIITWNYGSYWQSYGQPGPEQMMLMCGTGWLLIEALIIKYTGNKKCWNLMGHTSTTMLVGVLLLLPGFWFVPSLMIAFTILSFIVMLWNVIRRLKSEHLSPGYSLIWVSALILSFSLFYIIH